MIIYTANNNAFIRECAHACVLDYLIMSKMLIVLLTRSY